MIHQFLLAIGAMFGLMGSPADNNCAPTSCILTESSSDLQTESGSNLITET